MRNSVCSCKERTEFGEREVSFGRIRIQTAVTNGKDCVEYSLSARAAWCILMTINLMHTCRIRNVWPRSCPAEKTLRTQKMENIRKKNKGKEVKKIRLMQKGWRNWVC